MTRLLFAAVAALAFAAPAPAAIITFNGLPGPNVSPILGGTYAEAGFTVSVDASYLQGLAFGNPLPSIFTAAGTTAGVATVTRTGGGTFTFAAADLANGNNQTGVGYIYEGLLGGNPVFSTSGPLAFGVGVFGTVASPSGALIDQLRITITGPANTRVSVGNIDNINVTATADVPEPGTLAVFGLLAMGGLVARRRKA